MKNYPIPIKQREPIESLTGIKSSLSNIRQVISLTYLLYVVNGRKSSVDYCISLDDKTLVLKSELQDAINDFLSPNNIDRIINENPLLKNQYEPLYVGMTLLFRLCNLKMQDRQNTAERTGGLRYPKQIYFASNIVVLDLILSGFPDDILKLSLYEWLNNKVASDVDFENKVGSFLSISTAFTIFKIRDDKGKEIFFQTEGLYQAIKERKDEIITIDDSKESVGPTRIYKNIIKEELEPWITETGDGLLFDTSIKDVDPQDFLQILSTTLDICKVKDESVLPKEHKEKDDDLTCPLQKIFYGTPGSGKSHKVKELVEGKYPSEAERNEYVYRTTFHPDSDYASFVGCYKPRMEGKDIEYKFTPQVFTLAYEKAWKEPEKQVYLIIEEINRGNCAQIFGDLFQLLDRKGGVSEYSINADADLRQHLEEELGVGSDGIKDGKLKLPANLNILATMNTSDQSLFPMDSAFKRRWSWECVPIDYEHEESSKFNINIGGKPYAWSDFLKAVNEKIVKATDSEDKQMGNFFINGDVDERQFIDKVMFYLWNDICKEEYHTNNNFFRNFTDDKKAETEEFSFNQLFETKSTALLDGFMDFLGVKQNSTEEVVETE